MALLRSTATQVGEVSYHINLNVNLTRLTLALNEVPAACRVYVVNCLPLTKLIRTICVSSLKFNEIQFILDIPQQIEELAAVQIHSEVSQ